MLASSYIMRQPMNLIMQFAQRIDELGKDASAAFDRLINTRGEKFKRLVQTLEALSPLAILTRGYSVTVKLPEGAILKDTKSLKENDLVETKLGKGKFKSRVEEVD
jgi:exodeoxyribonuclease VII large subunit